MSHLVKRKIKPVLPIYLVALTWIVCALLFPIYKTGYFLITLGLSLIVYFVSRKLCPMRIQEVEVDYATGSETADELLNNISSLLSQLHQLNEDIPDAHLSAAMDRMETAGKGIIKEVEHAPDKATQISRFSYYYLPEVVNIMTSYLHMEQSGAKGENSTQIINDIHKNADTMATVFENQLDALYQSNAMDISTDLEVLNSIAQSQNLLKSK